VIIEKLAKDGLHCVKKLFNIIKNRPGVNELTFLSSNLSFLVKIIRNTTTPYISGVNNSELKSVTLKTKLNNTFSKNNGLTVVNSY